MSEKKLRVKYVKSVIGYSQRQKGTIRALGLKRLGEEVFDAMLLDLNLPDSRGLDTLVRAQAQAPAVPIVVLTGLADEAMGIEAVKRGAQDYLAKGQVDGNLLVRALRHAIERRRAEEALRHSKERFRSLVETTSDWIWEVDRQAAYTYASPRIEGLLGYKPEEVIGKTPFDLMPPDEAQRVAELFRSIVESREPWTALENTSLHKDGRSVVLETSGVPVLDARGGLVGYRGIDRDITQRKRVQQELQEGLQRLRRVLEDTIGALASMVEMKDPYTAGHQRRVSRLVCAMAEQMGFGHDRIDGLRMAALVHDVGKIKVPSEILSRPGQLSNIEFDLIKCHPQAGSNLMKTIDFQSPVWQTVLQHHENMDGSGYPLGTPGGEVITEARVLRVADVVEAMCSHRPYRAALGIEKALEEISVNRGLLYDPQAADACLTLFVERGFGFDGGDDSQLVH